MPRPPAILASVPGVILLPIETRDAKGVVDDDWLFMHVTSVVAVDHVATKFGKHPEGEQTKRQPLALGWRQSPNEPLFRLKQHRWITCAARPLFDQLHRASKKKIVEATPPYSHYQPKFYPLTF